MTAYIARRILLAVFTVWMISVLTFIIIELPEGDTADAVIYNMMLEGPGYNPEMAEVLRNYLGLDEPKHIRYGKWVWNLLQGDAGQSMSPRDTTWVSVKQRIGDRLWLTVALTGFTIVVTWTFGLPVGIYSAVRQHSIGDYIVTLAGFSGLAVPDFLLGLVLMYIGFAYFHQSVGGLFSADYTNVPWSWGKAYDLLKHLLIPAVVLGTSGTAGLIRVMRNNLLDELGKPYVVTARAKGVSPVKVILKYPVRLAINPFISSAGYLLPSLVSGSVIVSIVLSLPTLGPVLLDAILLQDAYTAGFIMLMLGILTVVGTLVSDILLAVVDPRIKFTK